LRNLSAVKYIVPQIFLVLLLLGFVGCGAPSNPKPTSNLQIITTSLAPARVGSTYNQTLTASGGVPPYTWSVSTGALPEGISLNTFGTLNGTPTKIGSFSFVVEVTDSAQNSQFIGLSGPNRRIK
jgi:hypothetical protein